MTTTIGVISDTHGLLRPEAARLLTGCAAILHAGDIGDEQVAIELAKIAPLYAVRGNIDRGEWARHYPATDLVAIEGHYFYLLHNLKDLDIDPLAAGVGVVVSGHSHRPGIELRDGVLYCNPGSAGPRRFSLPVTLAYLYLDPNRVTGEIVHIFSS